MFVPPRSVSPAVLTKLSELMARARNIKPSFFTNHKLAKCEFAARLLFAGLWTIADREGRLEDIPEKIKVLVLPYDNIDCDKLLNQLTEHEFIIRYEVNKSSYIQILNFAKHQNPHVKEGASTIPAPDKHHTSMVQNVPLPPSPIPIIKDKKYFFDATMYKKLCEKAINSYISDEEKKFIKEYESNQIKQLKGTK